MQVGPVLRDDRPADEIIDAMTDGLEEALGHPVPVFLHDAPTGRAVEDILALVPEGEVLIATRNAGGRRWCCARHTPTR